VIGRIVDGQRVMPLVLAIHHQPRGLYLGAILTDPDDVSILFSYTHSEFVVRLPDPAGIIGFIRSLIPHRRLSELYNAVGFRKHGKTELYRDLARHLAETDDRFVYAPGIPGLVMIVFTLTGYDLVFKVMRDRFPPQKTITRDQVRAGYAIVSRHDRAGRLIDANEFRKLAFSVDRFAPDLLAELRDEAGRTVSVVGDQVRFDDVYVERQVTPLDLYLRGADHEEAVAAMVDYGTAIKNLAATNIFPGDMLIKNFGVTRRGRVVFYDYDELSLLTECNFREIPETDDADDELAAAPWFGVGKGDIFPEELRSFLGVRPELRAAFEERHGDLYGTAFWRRVQDRISRGESIEIFPYRRAVALRGP
jgi:isocitrate dehydrogenase kinase/phosphatase